MSKDIYYPEYYKCPTCKVQAKYYVWASQLQTKVQICTCGTSLTFEHIVEEEIIRGPMIMGPKLNNAQIKADRRKRSQDHFKKDILPTLGRAEQVHFSQKYKNKK